MERLPVLLLHSQNSAKLRNYVRIWTVKMVTSGVLFRNILNIYRRTLAEWVIIETHVISITKQFSTSLSLEQNKSWRIYKIIICQGLYNNNTNYKSSSKWIKERGADSLATFYFRTLVSIRTVTLITYKLYLESGLIKVSVKVWVRWHLMICNARNCQWYIIRLKTSSIGQTVLK